MRTLQMEAGLRYGVFVSVVMVAARALGPMGWTLLWIAVSCQLACLAVITWRRTRLPFMTAGASLGVVAGLVMILVGRRESRGPAQD